MSLKHKIVAIIPARGGSKSIPHKNIVDVGGKPLIAYSIEALKKSRVVQRVIVSTDDKKIRAVALRYGAEAPFLRPKRLAEDTTPTIPVIRHALLWLEKKENYKPEYVILSQPTEPFLQPAQVDSLYALMRKKHADSGITMVAVGRTHHPYHVRAVSEKGLLEFDNPALHYAHPQRQMDPKRYAFGNVYCFRRDLFLKELKIEVGKRVGLEIDPLYAHDINMPLDLEIARFLIDKKIV